MKLISKIFLCFYFISNAVSIPINYDDFSDINASETSNEDETIEVKDHFDIINIMANVLNVRIDDIGIEIFGQIPAPFSQTTTMKMTPEMMEELDKMRAYSRDEHKFEDDLTYLLLNNEIK
ncbi:hypothetical protein PVAND_013059 [Polypedilum vanderplanki]|uniref:Uncharacterized protein n=1 Tax=Polypedilum vanderplanki TaxID=319348 RepID=A0A9J6CQB0_POLVA|nr:hypothetical protein PVAND_013059 [Polypedilum vanderplanki]